MLKKIAGCVLAAALGAALLAGTQAMSQEGQKPGTPSMEEVMKMYEKLNTPGPEHARFKEAVGTWKTETKMWMGPGEPSVSYGVSKMETILGGRYMKEHFRCTMMDQPFEGLALAGFDNHRKKYISVWLDNLSTDIMVMEGTFDEATKTGTYVGDYDDPFFGPTKMKNVVREISKDKHIFEMFKIGPDGTEQKEMEITYTRQ